MKQLSKSEIHDLEIEHRKKQLEEAAKRTEGMVKERKRKRANNLLLLAPCLPKGDSRIIGTGGMYKIRLRGGGA